MTLIEGVQNTFEKVELDSVSSFNIKEEASGFLYRRFAIYDPNSKAILGTIEANKYFSNYNFLNPFNWATSYTFTDTYGNTQLRIVKNYGISDFKLDAFIAAVWGIFSTSGAKSTDFCIYDGEGRKIGLIDGHLVNLKIVFDIQNVAKETFANIKVDSRGDVATLNRKNTSGAFGTIKADDETLEKGDVAIHMRRGVVDDRIVALLSTHLMRYDLIKGLNADERA